ncbi:RNA polymerase sigma factor [Citrobacter enshiensis]|uniref:RNA polymerase sigma factor n=1 Tax=Citrobacter enshiensis TaxID=2971264 RepID=UPI0023E830A6|nr:RNA polymerase sigma factor [Citrobacter enshiensis]WET42344.1 RNA polymerase sigma factor [Citrobacter enshiensis]
MPNTQSQSSGLLSAHTPDPDLVSRAALGDTSAFTEIMRRHNRLLFRTARSILKNDAEAEDALQEAYLNAWRALKGFRSEATLSTWLVRIVVNESLGRLRRKTASVIPLDAAMNAIDSDIQASLSDNPEHHPDYAVMQTQMRQLLEARIDLLPEAFRTVFMLRAVEELSVEQISHALDIPEATVRTRFFRARSLLREGLASQMDIALNDTFAFDGARCDRIVAGVLDRAKAEGLSNPKTE